MDVEMTVALKLGVLNTNIVDASIGCVWHVLFMVYC